MSGKTLTILRAEKARPRRSRSRPASADESRWPGRARMRDDDGAAARRCRRGRPRASASISAGKVEDAVDVVGGDDRRSRIRTVRRGRARLAFGSNAARRGAAPRVEPLALQLAQPIGLGAARARLADMRPWRSQAAMPPTTTPTPTRSRRSGSGTAALSARRPDAPPSNGSNETVTICAVRDGEGQQRASAMGRQHGLLEEVLHRHLLKLADRTGRPLARKVEIPPPTSGRRRLVQPLAHFLAGLEERHGLLVDRAHGRRCADCGRCAPAAS